MMQKSQIQFSQPTTHFYWNEKLDFTLMDNLKNNCNSQLQYVISLFNIFCNTNFHFFKIENHIHYLPKK
jgi:hypothetical protein